jgi:hypothetical protein
VSGVYGANHPNNMSSVDKNRIYSKRSLDNPMVIPARITDIP